VGRTFVVAVSAAALGCLGCLALFDPATAGFYPPCPFHALSGLYCPGCGSLRALHQLAHGHLLAALDLNGLTVLALPLVLYAWLSAARTAFGRRPLPVPRLPRTLGFWALAVVLAFWVLRNLPWYPWQILAP
jgi:hypothetical protein